MTIKRQTMKFLVPVSVSGIQSETLSGRRVIPCYISPQSFKINEKKLIKETFTKGGYYIEYWGEELPTIMASGTTGSGGIEAIEILRAIYRNEQQQIEQLLLNRAREIQDTSQQSLLDTSAARAQRGVLSAVDSLFQNGFSEIIDGTKSVIEEFSEIFEGSFEQSINQQVLIPSLGTYAVAVDVYMQGFKYRGYFSDFSVTETADDLGLFNYSFSFKVLRRTGKRSNFMPWHRNPYDANGNPIEASIPSEGPKPEELSYPTNIETFNSIVTTDGLTQFSDAENITEIDPNNVGINRLKKVRS